MIAVDTNILVYAHRREVQEHQRAAILLRELAESSGRWAIPWPCCAEFFSVVTNAKIWREKASRPEQAWSQLRAWAQSPSCTLLSEDESTFDLFGELITQPRVRGPVVHDARVAAICMTHGCETLFTRDRDFSLFPGLQTRNPLA